MTERKKDILFQAALLAVLILFFSKILFTGKIIRAPDITNEYYWSVLDIAKMKFWDCFNLTVGSAGWDMFSNSGTSVSGGTNSLQFFNFRNIIYLLIPPPTSVAWFIVLHLFFGAAGVYCCCRLIGASRFASFLGGLIFAVAPENASLINAGHVMKIATISFAPWAFYFFEKAFQTRRLIFFLTTGLVLALQFFNIHWQIAYYTCLGMGVYGVMRSVGIILEDTREGKKDIPRLIGLNLVVLLFFLSTVAISLAPLAEWSKDTNRGVNSGANTTGGSDSSGGNGKAKGGLERSEAMSWSLPPEELGAFVIPGFFGLSRQEGGENPTNIMAYYWGRMRFTQTVTYMGLLPWLLLPLPLIFRRDRYTWLALAAIGVGILFSMGEYTPFYNFLFDYFPGINRFRVPKMIMFIPVMGLGVMAARGLDLLLDEEIRRTKQFKNYLYGLLALPGLLLVLLGVELAGKGFWLNNFKEIVAQPTRYEQGPQLVGQRWNNLVVETGIAVSVAAAIAAAIFAWSRKWIATGIFPFILLAIYLADVGRVNSKFMFLVDAPQTVKGGKTQVMEYLLSHGSNQYRVLPMDGGDPMRYVTNGIPVMFTSNAVQQQRWQNFLDTFSFTSAMPDMMNVKYLVLSAAEYEKEKSQFGMKYFPVFQTPRGAEVVLENRTVLPKAWLVPAVARINDLQKTFAILQSPVFDPRKAAIVESPPPFSMEDPNSATPLPAQNVSVSRYEGERIGVDAQASQNALLVLGEKYYKGWKATVDGKPAEIYPVDHILRGVYLTPGIHKVEFVFDPLPFKVGKWLTLTSFAFFACMLVREWRLRRGNSEEKETEIATWEDMSRLKEKETGQETVKKKRGVGGKKKKR